MSGPKVLIDTNVIIGLEDHREVLPTFAKFIQLCGQYGVRIFIHELAIVDIQRDADAGRRAITLSKVRKFEQLTGISMPERTVLIARFGTMAKVNDEADVAFLHALDIGAVDFLVSQDQGIHARARRAGSALADRVLTVDDALNWLTNTFETKAVKLPLIEEVPAHAVPFDDDIFESLREGYPEFDRWWRQKCVAEHRPCWIITIENELAGLIVRKQETHAEARTVNAGTKILKICTFKVKPKFRGEKLGELLLKQALWFAQKNAFDLIYVTTFPSQSFLIRVLEYFGFEHTSLNSLGELVYEKRMSRDRLSADGDSNLFELARTNYPRFVARLPAQSFCVPIQGEYHDTLFPELVDKHQPDLFEAAGIPIGARTPGNTIRKVYLCRANTHAVEIGSVLIFYRSKSPGYRTSQSITSVGVVERISEATTIEELVRMTAKRSAYSTEQLTAIVNYSSAPVEALPR